MVVDFGKGCRAGFPDRFFDRLFQDGVVAKTDRVLGVGTGTGAAARGLAQRGCIVTDLDPSTPAGAAPALVGTFLLDAACFPQPARTQIRLWMIAKPA
jgi:hypothetical protein